MIALPKPRGFWHYALFALIVTGALLFLFWMEASEGVRWTDATVAFAAAVLCVLAIVLFRRGEKAKWIAQPTRYAQLIIALGAIGWMSELYMQMPTCSIAGISLPADSALTWCSR